MYDTITSQRDGHIIRAMPELRVDEEWPKNTSQQLSGSLVSANSVLSAPESSEYLEFSTMLQATIDDSECTSPAVCLTLGTRYMVTHGDTNSQPRVLLLALPRQTIAA